MARIKRGKNVRLPENALPMLEELREKMGRTSHIGGMVVNPALKLGDGLGYLLGAGNDESLDESRFQRYQQA